MRLLFIAAIVIASGGCAVLQKQAALAPAASAPAVASVSDRPVRFTPAFGAGAPVALIPCRGEASLGGTCKRSNASHERRGEMPSDENSATFGDATTVSLTTE